MTRRIERNEEWFKVQVQRRKEYAQKHRAKMTPEQKEAARKYAREYQREYLKVPEHREAANKYAREYARQLREDVKKFRALMKEKQHGKTDIETKEGSAFEHVRGPVASGVPDSGQVSCTSSA